MSPIRIVASFLWAVGWATVFWLGHRGPLSIVGTAACVAWIIGGVYCTLTGTWHKVFAGLYWREAKWALLYLLAGFGAFAAAVKLTSLGDAPRVVIIAAVVLLTLPTCLFVPSFFAGLRQRRLDQS